MKDGKPGADGYSSNLVRRTPVGSRVRLELGPYEARKGKGRVGSDNKFAINHLSRPVKRDLVWVDEFVWVEQCAS